MKVVVLIAFLFLTCRLEAQDTIRFLGFPTTNTVAWMEMGEFQENDTIVFEAQAGPRFLEFPATGGYATIRILNDEGREVCYWRENHLQYLDLSALPEGVYQLYFHSCSMPFVLSLQTLAP